ncbi:MAG: hypothetical protein MPW15_12910 [Candidatus Manganitrophus sp.]|nr:hypothetical protein [Candidatus Manganitrophus sp.]
MMHPIDVIEDFVISRGIAHFEPEMPSTFTVGSLSALERLSDRLREEMVGLGLQEVFSNVLGSRQEFVERMRVDQVGKERPEGRLIEIKNPMTERFSILRPWLLPSLLRVESASSKAFYPHRIFEVGEVARFTPSGEETETRVHLAALMAHPTANFSELARRTGGLLLQPFAPLSIGSDLSPDLHRGAGRGDFRRGEGGRNHRGDRSGGPDPMADRNAGGGV